MKQQKFSELTNLLVITAVLSFLTISCSKSSDSNNTLSQNPIVTTVVVSNISQISATGGGNVTSQGSSNVIGRGICWSTSQNPTIADAHTSDGAGTGSFTSNLTGLTENTLYYVRSYATNSDVTAYGNQVSFTTLQQGGGGTVTDIDGNIYHTITIGTQIWMVENLKTTKLNDGTSIPLVTDNTAWSNLTTLGYCWYNNDAGNKGIYGALYNWFTVKTGKLAPVGWHIPTIDEWGILRDYLGGYSIAGGKLKEVGTVHWMIPNTGATNESGFTGLPGGGRGYHGSFSDLGKYGEWWAVTESGTDKAFGPYVSYNDAEINFDEGGKVLGFSVRCIKN